MKTCRWVQAVAVVALIALGAGCNGFRERVFLKKGNELYTAQKYEEAIKQYAEILKINPSSWDANYLTAVSYLALYHPGSEHPKDKDYAAKGLAAFEHTLELTAPDADTREKTEKFYLSFLDSAGEKDKAVAYLEKQLASRPNDLALMLNLTPRDSILACLRYARHNANGMRARIALAGAEQLASRPNDLALINQIATLYQKKGDFTKALEYFEKRANMDPTNKEAWYTLGVNCWARSYKGGFEVSQEERELVVDKGINALDKALAIDPNYFDALSYINLIYREKAKALTTVGKTAEAGQAYAKADEYQKRAIELRKSQTAKPKPS